MINILYKASENAMNLVQKKKQKETQPKPILSQIETNQTHMYNSHISTE